MRELLELRAVIKGKVQKVGFRATVKYHAEQLKLTGFSRNLPDGDVEICAQGEKAALQQLLDQLRQEFGSKIQSIEHTFHPVDKTYLQALGDVFKF